MSASFCSSGPNSAIALKDKALTDNPIAITAVVIYLIITPFR